MIRKFKVVIFVLIVVILPGASFSADFNSVAAKYVVAAQKKDLATLFNMNIYYQSRVEQIKKTSPKFMVTKNVQALFEGEKNAIESNNQLWLFEPSMKWKLLEAQRKPKAYDGLYGNIYTLYIEMVYRDIETAPLFNKRPIKRLIASIDFSENRKQYMGIGGYGLTILEKEVTYWQLPLKIANFQYKYDENKLVISFDITGGKPDTIGGTPPYSQIITVEDDIKSIDAAQNEQKLILINEFFEQTKYGTSSDFMTGGIVFEYKAGKRIRSFEWPPGTKFPLAIGLAVFDSSKPQLTDVEAIIIEEGKIADKGEYVSGKVKKMIKKKPQKSTE